MNGRRTGRLARWLTVAFVVFALVAMVASCAFVYINTRATYLDSQNERLSQLENYAAHSIGMTADSSGESTDSQAWLALGDELDPDVPSSELYLQLDDLYQQLIETENQMLDLSRAGQEDSPAYAQLASQFAQLDAAYVETDDRYYWSSLNDMMQRIRNVFDLSSVSLYLADEQTHQITYLMDVVADDAPQGISRHATADVEQRDPADYPALWQAYEAVAASDGMSISPDGSLYLAYLACEIPDGQI